MSRIGNRILTIPENVTVSKSDNIVTVKGPKGELSTEINNHIDIEVNGNELTVKRDNDNYKNFHGTANANISNMIEGVTKGFEKNLESLGVGYRFAANVRKIREPEPYKGKGIRYKDEVVRRKEGKKAS